ncbi:MAG TPA: alpha-mannosidase [Rubrobacteraceae bacterium]|nr:alpha-mannosidase [Rubrobacteraceae bacterium]
MEIYDRHRLERHARRIEELRLWRNAYESPVKSWRFVAGEESGASGESYDIEPGDFWPEIGIPVRLTARTRVPEEWAGLSVELELWLGGEGFVEISVEAGASGDRRTASGLNPFHRSFPVLEEALGGEGVEIEAEVVSKGMFGSNVSEPRLELARLVVPEAEVRALERDLTAVFEVCAALDDHEVVPRLLDALDAAGAVLSTAWPTATDVTLTRYLEGFVNPIGDVAQSLPPNYAEKTVEINRHLGEPWSLPPAPGPLGPPPEEAREAVREARRVVASRLGRIREEYPPVGRLALTGHAHLDLAWLWPVAETRRKARRTFASVLGLMERYEDFNFNQSSAQLYQWIEDDDPGLFERVRERVAEGRWEPVGGSWVEPDCQLPGGEAFARQLFYGQRYFEERFGRRCAAAWFPDTFGYSPGLPQLLRGVGLSGFFTYKLNWNETNDFPHDLFVWEGIDGSRVVAHTFENPGTDYNGDVIPRDLYGTWRNFKGKRYHGESLFSFGWGDGGGGPSERMLENYARLRNFPAMPRLRMARVDDFFAALPEDGLPRWVGELYLELHRGTLTTQAKVKKLNREAEHRLLEAEAFATLAAHRGAGYPSEKLERLWKTLLLNQFHDILPGSSISEVYEDTHRELGETVAAAGDLRDLALKELAGERGEAGLAESVLVANAALHPRPLTAILPVDDGLTVAGANGEPLPAQRTAEGLLVHASDRTVPGLGWTPLALLEDTPHVAAPEASGIRVGGSGGITSIENELLRVEIGADGSLDGVYDREAGREVLDGRGNLLLAYADKPANWDAWDVQEGYEAEGEEVPGAESVEVVEAGPLRAAVRVERRFRGSRISQTYKLLSGSRRLDIETRVQWRERQVLLRALFPLNVRSHEATFETMYGVVRRPTHRNTSWDAARFEVSAHRFADLSEPGYGVALLNDGKYGHSARDNVLGISLLRGPLYPDPLADEGEHRFTYSLFPHPGDWTEAGVTLEAFSLNSPLLAMAGGGGPVEYGLVAAGGLELALGALKRAEGGRGVILRLYEPHGKRGHATLRFAFDVERIQRVNLLEEPEGEVEKTRDNEIRLDVRPFEVLTLRLEPEAG